MQPVSSSSSSMSVEYSSMSVDDEFDTDMPMTQNAVNGVAIQALAPNAQNAQQVQNAPMTQAQIAALLNRLIMIANAA